jgi:hypothetical protein
MQLAAETSRLDPWPQLLLIPDAATLDPRVSSFVHDGCRDQLGMRRLSQHKLPVERLPHDEK